MQEQTDLTPAERSEDSGRSYAPYTPRVFFKKAGLPDRWLAKRLLAAVGNPPVTIALWDGTVIQTDNPTPVAGMVIRDRQALQKLLADPEYEFGELYNDRRIEIEGDLVAFLECIYRHIGTPNGPRLHMRVLRTLTGLNGNSEERARDNIHHHYDIGNDFYRLWLDERMVYTCAYFPTPDTDLEAAQIAKLDHVCRKLRLRPGERVVEAGCGWGALALHMARHYGVRVTAYNISSEQIAYARELSRCDGLNRQVEFIEDDYRNLQGEYDAFVSVGMLEHVGIENYPVLGKIIDTVLAPDGRGLIHTIGRDRPYPMNTWIQQRIFPGAYPPSLSEMMKIFEPADFSVLDIENLRLHYAKTLHQWLARFDANVDRIEAMFDASFARMWRLYLAGSIAAFTTGTMQLFQVTFNRHGDNNIPWTRDHLYRDMH